MGPTGHKTQPLRLRDLDVTMIYIGYRTEKHTEPGGSTYSELH